MYIGATAIIIIIIFSFMRVGSLSVYVYARM